MRKPLLVSVMLLLNAGSFAQNAPIFITQPTNQTVLAGGAATFEVAVSGVGPFAYQWRLNGTNVPQIITTVAGNGIHGYAGDGGAATNASLNSPASVAVDGLGNLFIADRYNRRVRKVGADGIINTVAGNGTLDFTGDGGPAINAGVDSFDGVAVDNLGNLYIAEYRNKRVRKVGTDGIISTVAGNGSPGFSGDGGPATSASLDYPGGIAVDAAGNFYIADYIGNRIRKVATNGTISTVAGDGTMSRVWAPYGVAVDDFGNLFVTEVFINKRISKVGADGKISFVAAGLDFPAGVAVDGFGNLFIADYLQSLTHSGYIRRVGIDGSITIVAGGGGGGDGGAATNARLSEVNGVAVDHLGNLFIADTGNSRIRKVAAGGPKLAVNASGAKDSGSYDVVITNPYGSVTSSVVTLTVLGPPEIAQQPVNYAAPLGGSSIFRALAIGTGPLSYQWYLAKTALAGQTQSQLELAKVEFASAGDYTLTVSNLYGSTTSAVATLAVGFGPSITIQPASQPVLAGGNLVAVVAASGTGPLTYQWRFNGTNLSGTISTLAGGGNDSGEGAVATAAGLMDPAGVALDSLGNVFFAERGNNRIRKVGTDGIISTVAGNSTYGYSGDGGPATGASLKSPSNVTVDRMGNFFIADVGNQRVRRVGTDGIITTVAGGGPFGSPVDGAAAIDAFLIPTSVAVDLQGNLLIAEQQFHQIRKVGTNGIITTVAGNGMEVSGPTSLGYFGDGGPATDAHLNYLSGLTVDGLGNVFIADAVSHSIRKVGANGLITTFAGNGVAGYSGDGGAAAGAEFVLPSGLAVDSSGNLFISDGGSVREVGTNGIISTVAGGGTDSSGNLGDGRPATRASFYARSVAVDGFGNLFIADGNNRIRKVTPAAPALVLNNLAAEDAGDYDVVVTNPFGSVTSSVASLTVLLPPSITQDPTNQIMRVRSNATFSVAVTGTAPLNYQWYFGRGALPNQTNSILNLADLRMDDAGEYHLVVANLYGSVTSSTAELKIGFAPFITSQPIDREARSGGDAAFTVAVFGTGPFTYQWQFNGTNLPNYKIIAGGGTNDPGDGGPATSATLEVPAGLVFDLAGNLLIADRSHDRIRSVATNGIITTVAGNGRQDFSGDCGLATNAGLYYPEAIALDSSGNIFFTDQDNSRVRWLSTNGVITTVAGGGTNIPVDGGFATNANFALSGLAVDNATNLFIADHVSEQIFKVGTNGLISVVAGTGATGFSGDGGPATQAELNYPTGLTLDRGGALFIAENYNYRVRKVDTNGVISTVVGNATYGLPLDGIIATNTPFFTPTAIAFDSSGNLLIAANSPGSLTAVGPGHIYKVGTNGIIRNVAGAWSDDGSAVYLYGSTSVALDKEDNIFVADRSDRVFQIIEFGPTLKIPNAGASNSGTYNLVVTSPFGTATSSSALLNVLPSASITLTGANQLRLKFVTASNITATLQSSVSLASPIQWTAIATNLANTQGQAEFQLSISPGEKARFYRVTQP